MKLVLVCLLAIFLSVCGGEYSFADKGSYVDSIQFIQYLDGNTALEEVRNGNLDIYYYNIPSDRIESNQAKKGLQVFDSTGGSYSILVNPAVSKKFNPFSIEQVRFALNYLVDRKLIVNEIMSGFGVTMVSNYSPFDADYLAILDQIELFNFKYNPILAKKLISESLYGAGAKMIDGHWMINNEPIEIIIFIRNDDPVRKSIGEILASDLASLGFSIKKDYGDLNKAFVVVYGSNPAELKWSLYTEGWGGRSAFVKYDSLGLAQMYSPWFSNMPGFNNPSYWNYKNDYLDMITQRIYTGNFSSAQERTELIQNATVEGVHESVRIFLASKIDQYVANEDIIGIINDFGAGVPSRFTPINARSGSDTLTIGVKQIYQGAWNPVMGLSDSYSTQIWNTLYDPGIFKHPYNGENFPIRSSWSIKTTGPDEMIVVPSDAIIWDHEKQQWTNVVGMNATSKITFDLFFSNWHHGEKMDMNDILYSIYFPLEWGSKPKKNDKTFDTEYTSRAAQIVNTLIGVRPIDNDTIEVYVNYWHFDETEIADWASVWSVMPWEIYVAMEQAVLDGKTSFSRSGATSKNVNWLSLLVPHDAMIISDNLELFKNSNIIPKPLEKFISNSEYTRQRYDASLDWIDSKDHAIISNGPFYLDRYSPESRTIQINAFIDDTYPFATGFWSKFEQVKFPKIINVPIPNIVHKGKELTIPINTEYASKLYYSFTNSQGDQISFGIQEIKNNQTQIILSGDKTTLLGYGASDLKLFAISDQVLRPDIYTTSFFVADAQKMPVITIDDIKTNLESESSLNTNRSVIVIIVILITIISVIIWRHKTKKNNDNTL